jgi:hypothetical protein
LADIFLQDIVAHAPLVYAGIQFLLFEIEAVFAIEIADRPDGFRQKMKTTADIADGRLEHEREDTSAVSATQFFLLVAVLVLIIENSRARATKLLPSGLALINFAHEHSEREPLVAP